MFYNSFFKKKFHIRKKEISARVTLKGLLVFYDLLFNRSQLSHLPQSDWVETPAAWANIAACESVLEQDCTNSAAVSCDWAWPQISNFEGKIEKRISPQRSIKIHSFQCWVTGEKPQSSPVTGLNFSFQLALTKVEVQCNLKKQIYKT